jgi:hypothetical protein
MQDLENFQAKRTSKQRIVQHVAFWIMAWLLTAFVYGYEKQSILMALKVNLMLLPIHMIYFYTVAYFIIPRYLITKKYIQFSIVLLIFVAIMPGLTRLFDILLVEPQLDAYLKSLGYNGWPKVNGSFWERFSNMVYYLNAFRGTNLVIWSAIAIKFFQSWYQRHNAALQAELHLLKAQVHPHFLFNTLNNLYALTLNNSPKSPEIVLGLSEILRYMLYECDLESVPLKKDVEMLENFALLERMRYEERLDFNFTVEGKLENLEIAPLLLLPLVENAFKHGAGEKVGQAWINMELKVDGDLLTFKINNSKPEQSANEIRKGSIGIYNLKKRLDLIYPKAHQLKIFDEEEMFVVILKINLLKKEMP